MSEEGTVREVEVDPESNVNGREVEAGNATDPEAENATDPARIR